MELNRGNHASPGRLLVVADWTADPSAVVALCGPRLQLDGTASGSVVPDRR